MKQEVDYNISDDIIHVRGSLIYCESGLSPAKVHNAKDQCVSPSSPLCSA